MNSNQHTVVNSFIDIGGGLVLSTYMVRFSPIVYNIENKRIIVRPTMRYRTNCLHVKHLLTYRLHGKAAEHS